MAMRFCTVCGAVLRDGVCPQGHPQRAARGRPSRGRRRWVRRLVALVVVVALVGAAGYVALYWYPNRAAGDLMRETSAEWGEAVVAYREAVDTLPGEDDELDEVVASTEEILDRSEEARLAVVEAQTRLDSREPAAIPFISDRPPLDLALQLREDMLAFYVGSLEVIVALEDVADYLSDVTRTLTEVENLEQTIGDPQREQGIAEAVESGQPIAEQLLADLQSIEAPDELGAVHEELLAIGQQMRADLVEAAGGGGVSAGIIGVLLGDVGEQAALFRETVGQTPQRAREAGLGRQLTELRELAARIDAGLAALEEAGVQGVTVPGGA